MVIVHDTQIACNYCPVYFITECVGQVLPSKLESFALKAMNGLTVGNIDAVGGACSVYGMLLMCIWYAFDVSIHIAYLTHGIHKHFS